jgi:hypothetical protein
MVLDLEIQTERMEKIPSTPQVRSSLASEIGVLDIQATQEERSLEYLESQFTKDFLETWKNEPKGLSKTVASKWKQLGPLDLVQINQASPIYFEQKLGFGESADALGGKYFGQVNFNKEPHGLGRYITKTGEIYEGQWKFSEENGFGRRIWSTGEYYVGMWKDFKFHGPGKFVYKDGSVDKGLWENCMF